MCLMKHILHEMKLAVDHDGGELFEPDTLKKIEKRAIDGHLGSETL